MKRERTSRKDTQEHQEKYAEGPVLLRTEKGLSLTDGRQTMTGDFSKLAVPDQRK